MSKNTVTSTISGPEAIWSKTSDELRREMGDDVHGSWLAPAAVRRNVRGELCLVTPTGVARDWLRRYAWRRICDVWALNDASGRELRLCSRAEFEGEGAPAEPGAAVAEAALAPADFTPALAAPRRACGLQERFNFETFVVGDSNRFAHSVAQRIATWADGHFNPVLFHGPYGFGKTHLLNALGWEAMRNAPDRRVMYMTSERFLSGFLNALAERRMAAFKDDLRSADLLLIDDIQFIAGKQSTQEELFHTLAALMEDGRRVVVSADRPLSALTDLDARLRSYLSAGLACGISPAERSLRVSIVERKSTDLNRLRGGAGGVRPDVAQFLADRCSDSVRELEGALNVLLAGARGALSSMSLEEAADLLRTHLRGGERRVTVDEIQKAVAEHYGLKQADLLSPGRARALARPRQAAMWLAKQLTTRSLPDIGRRFGGRDHTTVLHAVRRIEDLRQQDARLARDLEDLVRKLRG